MRDTKGRADRELDDAADTVAGAYRVIDKVASRLNSTTPRRSRSSRPNGSAASAAPGRRSSTPARAP
jgi:hypothetical protein